MTDLSITQEYVICSVDGKGKISGFSIEKMVCFVAAGILELQMEGCIALEGKHVSVTSELPFSMQYLKPLYDFINHECIRCKKEIKLNKILEAYHISLTDKRYRELLDSVGASLVDKGLAQESQVGLLGSKKGYVPAPEAIRSVVEGLRAELLEEGKVAEETAALVILLEKAKCLKQYFSKFEQKEMKKRLRNMMDSPDGKLVKAMVDHVETLLAVLCVSASGTV
ncbi:MAG: GPP34 family phosphoprotein [Lachnospiraceae bacterium]|nr:GPP34 family phosphoprotein [Lachnospiraceae bacterium]